jgi:hypothetical protein
VDISNIIPSLVELFKDRFHNMDDMGVTAIMQLAKHGELHLNVFTMAVTNVYSGTSYGNWCRHSIVD